MITQTLLVGNPFFESYIHSDFLGKLIFIGLVILSIVSWILIIYKTWQTVQVRKTSFYFQKKFSNQQGNPLGIEVEKTSYTPNPFREIYGTLKRFTLELLNKNKHFGKMQAKQEEFSYLSPSDIDFVEAHLMGACANQTKILESNLFILATIVALAPFLGLLGTVWGILSTFSELQMQNANSHHMVLNGLSLALATTVLGLVDAIPALIGYNYLKNAARDFETDMERFAREILAAVEMQYRKVDVN